MVAGTQTAALKILQVILQVLILMSLMLNLGMAQTGQKLEILNTGRRGGNPEHLDKHLDYFLVEEQDGKAKSTESWNGSAWTEVNQI